MHHAWKRRSFVCVGDDTLREFFICEVCLLGKDEPVAPHEASRITKWWSTHARLPLAAPSEACEGEKKCDAPGCDAKATCQYYLDNHGVPTTPERLCGPHAEARRVREEEIDRTRMATAREVRDRAVAELLKQYPAGRYYWVRHAGAMWPGFLQTDGYFDIHIPGDYESVAVDGVDAVIVSPIPEP